MSGRMLSARRCTPARPGFTKSLDLPREGYSGISSEFGRAVEVATACFLGPGFEPEKGFARHAHFRVSGRDQRAREQVGPAASRASSKSGQRACGRAPPVPRHNFAAPRGNTRVAVRLRTSYRPSEDAVRLRTRLNRRGS